MSEQPKQQTEQIVRDVVNDPRTAGCTFVWVGPDGGVYSFGVTDGEEKTFEKLCAGAFLEFVSASERSQDEFLKAVVDEYNERKERGFQHHQERQEYS